MEKVIIWDDRKRAVNIAKHGLDFADLTPGFFETALVMSAKLDRFFAIGDLNGMRVIVAVFRPLGNEAISVISMRPANHHERKAFDDR